MRANTGANTGADTRADTEGGAPEGSTGRREADKRGCPGKRTAGVEHQDLGGIELSEPVTRYDATDRTTSM